MPKTKISEFSATPANNTDIDSINIAEGCAPSGINDAIRELMAQLKDFQTGAVGDSFNGPIGATTASTGAFTTLSATGVTTVQAGTAALPAITTTGDTNTGIFFPAADTIAFTEGGAEVMRIDSSSNLSMTGGGTINTPNTFGFKNRIINGAMVFDQRNAGASVTPTASVYTLDRWRAVCSVSSKFSVQQNAGAVTPPTGFTNYFGATSLSAYTVGSSEIFLIQQNIEGFNIADLSWGTANAKTVTLSFWVRSSLTGTFGGSLRNGNADRSYPFSYTINSANTWEYETITIDGDTTGTWATNSSSGVSVNFSLGNGATVSNTAGAWVAGNFTSATGATSVVGTNGATLYITGVQLEKGTQATSFDYRSYGIELVMCQRYCYKISTSGGYSTFATTGQFVSATRVDFPILFPTYMRASPTATYTAANTYLPSSAGTDFTPSAVASVGGSASPQAIAVNFTVSGGTAGRAATLTDLNTTSSSMIFSAEL